VLLLLLLLLSGARAKQFRWYGEANCLQLAMQFGGM